MKRSANAVWNGGLKDGKGTLATESGAIQGVPYSFSMRFENEKGTNPEELIAAAHAGCFSMALSGQLGERGMRPDSVETRATATMEKVDGKMTVTEIHLDVTCRIPNADRAKFEEATQAAKTGCPISRLLGPGTKITMQARLA
ncbi:MAG TPA: OsmC family protein [Candidatus Thermoplasmatota archaeon]|nr:OsmC family protein [Candidatus Thermoplasmatota archaeon]